MKLLLINPVDKKACTFTSHFPPLGLGYIAALTPTEFEIEFADENIRGFVPSKADLVAISAMTVQINRAYEISAWYRARGIPVVMGGIHPSMMPQEARHYATSVVIGEAEGIWPQVLQDFLNGSLKPIYKNLAYPSLHNLVIPRRDLFSRKYLFESIQTSRGCPFACDFCSVPVFNGKKYRFRPIEEVIEELKSIKKKFVFFVDDNIVGFGQENEQRAAALFEAMLGAGIKKHWTSQASVNVAKNDHLLSLMKRSGCLGLLVGLESIDQGTLQGCGKSQNLDDIKRPEQHYEDVIRKLHRYGIAINGYFCYGHGDTPTSIARTTEFITRSNLDIVNIPIVIPSPGTPLYRKRHDALDYKDYPADWNKYLGRLVYHPQKCSKEEFYKGYLKAVRKIYSLGEVLKRTLGCLMWSRSLFESGVILLTNLNYRRLRRRGISFLLREDQAFRTAYDDLTRGGKKLSN